MNPKTILALAAASAALLASAAEVRKPNSPEELQQWLVNMVAHHHFTTAEVVAATGLGADEVEAAVAKGNLKPASLDSRPKGQLLVLPYPGGRHPRIGFLDGAVDPQRETKISVFAPWDDHSYTVIDIPEAIWSNLGLTYLAHTHVPTIWSAKGVELPKLEWRKLDGGILAMERQLPNGVTFGTKAKPAMGGVLMEMWLRNGTGQKLTDMRVQNCAMLKGMEGMSQLTETNKLTQKPYVACHAPDKTRWAILAWEPCHRPWNNPPVPCLHSDPKFPDCDPGQTVRLKGWFSYYQGRDIEAELARLDKLDWRNTPLD